MNIKIYACIQYNTVLLFPNTKTNPLFRKGPLWIKRKQVTACVLARGGGGWIGTASGLFRILNGPNLMSVSVVFGNRVCHDNVLLWVARDSVVYSLNVTQSALVSQTLLISVHHILLPMILPHTLAFLFLLSFKSFQIYHYRFISLSSASHLLLSRL